MAIYDGCGMGPWEPGFLDHISGNAPTGFTNGKCNVCNGGGSLVVNSLGERKTCYNCGGEGRIGPIELCVHKCEEDLGTCPIESCEGKGMLFGPAPAELPDLGEKAYKVQCSECEFQTGRMDKEDAIESWQEVTNV
jgi:hypothetical protein